MQSSWQGICTTTYLLLSLIFLKSSKNGKGIRAVQQELFFLPVHRLSSNVVDL